MAFKVTWQPVLRVLALKDYHPAFADEMINVCVNPQPDFWQERETLQNEYSQRLFEAQAATIKAGSAKEDVEELARRRDEKTAELDAYTKQFFLPGIQDWFARLWSFGDEKWTGEDLNDLENTDPHLLAWLKRRSIEMIEEHRAGRKKA
jgi:hypothetical protein